MNNRKALSDLIARYDEADNMMRITSGETLSYWEEKRTDAEEEISAIIDDNFRKVSRMTTPTPDPATLLALAARVIAYRIVAPAK